MTNRPNILILICDQLRQDALGCYGNPVIETPHIDRLASQSVVFHNAFCSSPLCVPARISMLTGRYVQSFNYSAGGTGHSAVPHLPQILKPENYHTAALGKMHFSPCCNHYGFDLTCLSEDTGSGRLYKDDYQHYLCESRLAEWDGHGLDNWDILWGTSPLNEKDYVTTWNGDQALKYLTQTRPKDRPFFCVCSFPKPHPPFDPPAPYDTMYSPGDMPPPRGCDQPMSNRSSAIQQWHDAWNFDFCMPPHRRNRIASHYYGNVSLIDKQIGRILDAMKQEHLADNTIIIFPSDHGEQLGDQNCYMKHFGYDASIRIPLMIQAPAMPPGTNDAFVLQTDIVPTLCATLDIDRPRHVNGQNLLGLAAGQVTPRDHIVAAGSMADGWFAVQTAHWKYLYFIHGGEEELYDFSICPYETTNLAHDPAFDSTRQAMRSLLIVWLKELADNSDPGARSFLASADLHSTPLRPNLFTSISRRALAHRTPPHILLADLNESEIS